MKVLPLVAVAGTLGCCLLAHGMTSNVAIIPAAWCSRMWQWYIQLPGRSSGSQAIRTRPWAGTLIVSSQDKNCRCRPVYLDDLEEEAMEMERVIHLRLVHDVPYLQVPDADGVGVVMGLALDHPVDAVASGSSGPGAARSGSASRLR